MTARASRIFTLLATAAALLDVAPALAQAAPVAQPSAQPASAISDETPPANSNQVGEIVVTAQRVSQNLQKVPVAVTVVSGDELRSRDLNDLSQITLAVPSFSTGSDNSFAIRGVGSLVFSANIDSSVGVSVDEVSLGVPLFMSNGILDDVAQIEVLQGPQGLLFGRNASAGLLNIVSNRPRFDRVGGDVSVELDDRDAVPGNGFGFITRGTINVPLSNTLALRLNVLDSQQSPIADKVAGSPDHFDADQERAAVKAKLLYEPTPGTSFYLIGDYSRERGVGGIFDRTFRSVAPNGVIAPILTTVDGVTAGPDNLRYGSDGDDYRSVNTYGLSLNSSTQLSDAITVSDIAAWRHFGLNLNIDTDGTSADLLDTNHNKSGYNQYSNELRFAIKPNDKIDGQIGAYGFYSSLHTDEALQGTDGTGIADFLGRDNAYHQTLRSLAGFGQFQYHLTSALELIAGGRVTNDHITIDTRQNQTAYVITLGPLTLPARQTYSDTNFSWKLGTQYDVTQAITGYVTYSRGYKGPSFNSSFSVANQDLTIRPETVGDIEIGVKSFLFDRRLRLNLSLFREDFRNFQVQSLDVSTGVTATGNAGRVRSQGIEATAVVKPATGLTINAGTTLLDSRFRSYVGAACYLGQPNCLANGTFDAAGNKTPTAAKFTSNLEAIYEFQVSGTTVPFIELSYNHRSSINFSPNASPLTRLGKIDTLGGSIGVHIGPRFEASVFCKNCTNKIIPTTIAYDSVDQVLHGVSSTTQQFGYNSVRTIGVTASAHF